MPGGRLLGETQHLAAGAGVIEEVQDKTACLVQRDGVQVAERPVVRDDGLAAHVRAARGAEPGVGGEQLPQRVELVVVDQERVPGQQLGDLGPGFQAGDPPGQGFLCPQAASGKTIKAAARARGCRPAKGGIRATVPALRASFRARAS
jgi:hypothetical protein